MQDDDDALASGMIGDGGKRRRRKIIRKADWSIGQGIVFYLSSQCKGQLRPGRLPSPLPRPVLDGPSEERKVGKCQMSRNNKRIILILE